jgi:serine/threonine protein kinase
LAEDGKTYSTAADVYSYAIVMWELITRQVPYKGNNILSVMEVVQKGTRPDLPNPPPSNVRREYIELMENV